MKSSSKSLEHDRFLFVGNQLALDFVNTRPVVDGEAVELLPDFSSLLRWFHAAGVLTAPEIDRLTRKWRDSPRTQRALNNLKTFRETLRTDIIQWERGRPVRRSTIEMLNRLMAKHPMLRRIRHNGGKPEVGPWFSLDEPEALFAPIVHAAAELFSQAAQSRVRKCEVCVLHFLDTSKKGSRRWCSMQSCGNRSKVAAYAARQRRRRKS